MNNKSLEEFIEECLQDPEVKKAYDMLCTAIENDFEICYIDEDGVEVELDLNLTKEEATSILRGALDDSEIPYTIRKGRTIGVFDNWAECEKSVLGFS